VNKYVLNRKDSIVLTAIDIIHEQGLQGLSTREIAKRQGVSEPALYRQFSSKADIILAVLDHYSYYDSLVFNTVQAKQLPAKDGILFYMSTFSEYFENYPQITAVVMAFDTLFYEHEIEGKVREIRESHRSFLQTLTDGGKKLGDISTELSTEQITDTVLGIQYMTMLRWRSSKYEFSLKERVVAAIDSYLKLI
jgi:AcrR family transcriptional regulator